jgi:hypothetical protein
MTFLNELFAGINSPDVAIETFVNKRSSIDRGAKLLAAIPSRRRSSLCFLRKRQRRSQFGSGWASTNIVAQTTRGLAIGCTTLCPTLSTSTHVEHPAISKRVNHFTTKPPLTYTFIPLIAIGVSLSSGSSQPC